MQKDLRMNVRNFTILLCLMTLKGQYFEKFEWGIIHKPAKDEQTTTFIIGYL